jgi:hypothetical protein
LPGDKRFEVIVNDRFRDRGELFETARMEKDRVTTEALGHPRDGGLGAVLGPGDLSMRGAGGKPGRDGGE